MQPSSHDLLTVRDHVIRPAIGGKRTKKAKGRKSHKHTKGRKSRKSSKRVQKGGFYPSVMGNFIGAASKYIVPIALFAGYKLMNRTLKRK